MGRENSSKISSEADKDEKRGEEEGNAGRHSKAGFCQFSRQLPVDSRFTGRSGGWRRQAAAIRGFKTTYLAALFSLDTIVRGGVCVCGGVLVPSRSICMQVIPSDSARLRHERQSGSDEPPSQTTPGTVSSVPM